MLSGSTNYFCSGAKRSHTKNNFNNSIALVIPAKILFKFKRLEESSIFLSNGVYLMVTGGRYRMEKIY